MAKAIVTKDSHAKLVTEALPAAVDVLLETMRLDPNEEVENPETREVTKKFNLRINGQRVRAALGTVAVVERLGDQALRRQTGKQLSQVLKLIKEHKILDKKPKVIEHSSQD